MASVVPAYEITATHRRVRHVWNPTQSVFMQADPTVYPYVDLEGAVRAGKTTPLVARVHQYCADFPGIHCALTRYTQDGLNAQLKPRWRDWCAQNLTGLTWHASEEYDELENGSRVYLRALKAAEEIARYSKLAGLTLAILGIDQPEELPEDIYRAYVPARLSQAGYPHQVLLTPNPPGETHWIAKEFPTTNSKPGYLYLRTSVYDNRHNLGEEYVRLMEEAYPPGHSLRRRFIEGKRGLPIVGTPVYGSTFNARLHVQQVPLNTQVPLLEGWDFGHRHPAVVWCQLLPWGELRVLGGVMGVDMFIEDFAPSVVAIRNQWFGAPDASGVQQLRAELWSTGDPAGDQNNSQGTRVSAADVLREHGVLLTTIGGANHPDARDRAIQHLAGYQRRLTRQGPAFVVDPERWMLLDNDGPRASTHMIDALEAGYVWDERAYTTTTSPNTRRPRKDGYYDHSMNCLEYVVLAYGPAQPGRVDVEKAERKQRERAQRDEQDVPLSARRRRINLGAGHRPRVTR